MFDVIDYAPPKRSRRVCSFLSIGCSLLGILLYPILLFVAPLFEPGFLIAIVAILASLAGLFVLGFAVGLVASLVESPKRRARVAIALSLVAFVVLAILTFVLFD